MSCVTDTLPCSSGADDDTWLLAGPCGQQHASKQDRHQHACSCMASCGMAMQHAAYSNAQQAAAGLVPGALSPAQQRQA